MLPLVVVVRLSCISSLKKNGGLRKNKRVWRHFEKQLSGYASLDYEAKMCVSGCMVCGLMFDASPQVSIWGFWAIVWGRRYAGII